MADAPKRELTPEQTKVTQVIDYVRTLVEMGDKPVWSLASYKNLVLHEVDLRNRIGIRHDGALLDIATAEPRDVLRVRRDTIGYVSQFLRAVPRVPTIDVVAEPLVVTGAPREQAREQAGNLLRSLNIPERLWTLPPSTFSGGEQQRVNIARGFISDHPILLLDEPTASLDARNREVVVSLIDEKKRAGVAMVAIVHDDEIRRLIADRIVDVTSFAAVA